MHASRYDTYGWRTGTLTALVPGVANALRAELQLRNSSYYGGAYYKYRLTSGREARLFANYDAARSEWLRSRHAAYAVLLEVADLPDMEGIHARLLELFPEVERLQSERIEDHEDVD